MASKPDKRTYVQLEDPSPYIAGIADEKGDKMIGVTVEASNDEMVVWINVLGVGGMRKMMRALESYLALMEAEATDGECESR